jgi:YVTN family beta-propeller protein
MKRLRFGPALIWACLFAGASAFAFEAGGYHLLRKVSLTAAPGGGEYFDYIAFDAAARRAYLSHGTEVKVLDADTYKLIGNISGLKRDHGVAIVPELGRGFISDGDAGEVAVFDVKTLKITGHITTDKDSDSILYDPVSKHIFCFNGDPNSVSVIDPGSEKVIATLPLGGAPEQAVADGRGMIFDNLEDKNEVIAIDSRALKITSRWPVAPAGQPVSIAMDRQARRLFIGARNPSVFVMMDADTGKIIGPSFPIGARVDTTVFDPETRFAASSTGDGTIHIFHEDSANKISLVETVKTEYGAKTMALDPNTHSFLVDTADFSMPAADAKQPNARLTPKPGTFRLLVYGR